jgi:hypothetical protein
MSEYLKKEDTIQERAKIDVPPKISEGQKPIKGGEAPGFAPGTGIAKASDMVKGDDNPKETSQSEVKAESKTLLKAEEEGEEEGKEDFVSEEEAAAEDEKVDEEEEDEEEEDEEVSDEDINELKSLLKDIRNAVSTKEQIVKSINGVADQISAELKKSLPGLVRDETSRMLRKMGFTPTRPDVVKIGVNEPVETKKVLDEGKIEKSTKAEEDPYKIVAELSNKSWGELGRLREKMGHLKPF